MGIFRPCSVGLFGLCISYGACRAAETPTFDHHVSAILSRAGCNMGTCHGNLNGKGGLQLSLRGQNPWHDYLALTDDLGGRRVNRNDPAQSLMLLKPTAAFRATSISRLVKT